MSGISVRELISTLKKKKKKALVGNEWSNVLPKILASEEKATTIPGDTDERTTMDFAPILCLVCEYNTGNGLSVYTNTASQGKSVDINTLSQRASVDTSSVTHRKFVDINTLSQRTSVDTGTVHRETLLTSTPVSYTHLRAHET